MNRRHTWGPGVLLATAAALGIALSATAGVVERFWIDPAGGSFNDPDNWDGPVPDKGTTAIFALDGIYTVTIDANALSDRLLLRDGDLTLALKGATYSLLNPFLSTPSIVIGEGPVGFAECSITGGTLEAMFTELGQSADSFGALQVTGVGAALVSDFHLRVGHQGSGFLDVSSGGEVFGLEGVVGLGEDAFGLVTVTGADSLWMSIATLTIGEQGDGELFVFNGGTVSSGSGIVGQRLDSVGEVTLIGPGSTWMIDGSLDIGQSGSGSLLISSGAAVLNADFATIGTFAGVGYPPGVGGVGDVTVSGVGSTWTISGDLHVGFLNDGSLTVSNGGAVLSTNGFIRTFLGTGVAVVTGPGSTWINTGDLFVTDVLRVLDGAMVAAQSVEIEEQGVLEGDGTVQGEVTNRSAVSPGVPTTDPLQPSLGALTVVGNYTQGTDGTLLIDVAAFPPNFNEWESDVFAVSGDATLGGSLEVQIVVGGTPPLGTSFEIVTAASVTGEFDTLIAPPLCCDRGWLVVYEGNVVRLEVRVIPPGDLNGDFVVNVLDLIIMLLDFGDCPPACPSDVNGDGTVGVLDLIILLENFG